MVDSARTRIPGSEMMMRRGQLVQASGPQLSGRPCALKQSRPAWTQRGIQRGPEAMGKTRLGLARPGMVGQSRRRLVKS